MFQLDPLDNGWGEEGEEKKEESYWAVVYFQALLRPSHRSPRFGTEIKADGITFHSSLPNLKLRNRTQIPYYILISYTYENWYMEWRQV
jgi:hypothetical protein